jgi:hypothetical protein
MVGVMDADVVSPSDLFDKTVQYEIPPFQRPYVWTEEDQWQPLWDDIEALADEALGVDLEAEPVEPTTHFLGAVVIKQLQSSPGNPQRWWVIDGQQRLTTLQLLLDAAQIVTENHGEADDAQDLAGLVLNGKSKFASSPLRFKVWPSRPDRVAFEQAMDNDVEVSESLADARIARAHRFFVDAIAEWANVTGDPDKCVQRLAALSAVLQAQLQIVAIGLGRDDDDQLIFEALNDRGTPLLSGDLIKNWVFQKCDDLHVDAEAWSNKYWQEFDDDWWREQVAQGRLYRSRIDLFLQYWLTMRTLSEIPTEQMFKRFRSYATDHLAEVDTAATLLGQLSADAATFRTFAELAAHSGRGAFYRRVVESLELGAFIPLLLWTLSAHKSPPVEQADLALQAVESWAVRRTLLRRTMKDVNKLVVALLNHLAEEDGDAVGQATVEFLAAQTADAREWPSDEQVQTQLPAIKVYGNIKQSRIRAFFAVIEQHLRRDERYGDVALPEGLEVEHVMPRGWREHWGEGVADDAKLAGERDFAIHTIGNLTLVTGRLNKDLSNRPWTDAEAEAVAPTGKDAGVGKRSLLSRYNLFALNKEIVDPHEDGWTEADIRERSKKLAQRVTKIWPRPASPAPESGPAESDPGEDG